MLGEYVLMNPLELNDELIVVSNPKKKSRGKRQKRKVVKNLCGTKTVKANLAKGGKKMAKAKAKTKKGKARAAVKRGKAGAKVRFGTAVSALLKKIKKTKAYKSAPRRNAAFGWDDIRKMGGKKKRAVRVRTTKKHPVKSAFYKRPGKYAAQFLGGLPGAYRHAAANPYGFEANPWVKSRPVYYYYQESPTQIEASDLMPRSVVRTPFPQIPGGSFARMMSAGYVPRKKSRKGKKAAEVTKEQLEEKIKKEVEKLATKKKPKKSKSAAAKKAAAKKAAAKKKAAVDAERNKGQQKRASAKKASASRRTKRDYTKWIPGYAEMDTAARLAARQSLKELGKGVVAGGGTFVPNPFRRPSFSRAIPFVTGFRKTKKRRNKFALNPSRRILANQGAVFALAQGHVPPIIDLAIDGSMMVGGGILSTWITDLGLAKIQDGKYLNHFVQPIVQGVLGGVGGFLINKYTPTSIPGIGTKGASLIKRFGANTIIGSLIYSLHTLVAKYLIPMAKTQVQKMLPAPKNGKPAAPATKAMTGIMGRVALPAEVKALGRAASGQEVAALGRSATGAEVKALGRAATGSQIRALGRDKQSLLTQYRNEMFDFRTAY